MTEYPAWVEVIRGQFGGKSFLNIEEVKAALSCSKDYVYDRLADGSITAHNPSGKPGKKGTRIIAMSVWDFLKKGQIAKKEWNK